MRFFFTKVAVFLIILLRNNLLENHLETGIFISGNFEFLGRVFRQTQEKCSRSHYFDSGICIAAAPLDLIIPTARYVSV